MSASGAYVIYGSGKLIPAPFVDIRKSYEGFDSTIISTTYDITLNGTMVGHKGSPNSNGEFWTQAGYPPDESLANLESFESLIRKGEALRKMFSIPGQSLEIQPCNGTAPLKCNPRVVGIDIPEGQWTQVMPYTIRLQADEMFGDVIVDNSEDAEYLQGFYISSASESWQLEMPGEAQNDVHPHTFRLTHLISAKGKRHYEFDGSLLRQPWENAREFCKSRMGLDYDRVTSSGVLNLIPYSGFNHIRNETINEIEGSYDVNESWILSSGDAIETFTATVRNSLDDALTQITLAGEIRGLEINNISISGDPFAVINTKYQAASGTFIISSGQFLTRAQAFLPSGEAINSTPLSTQVGHNVANGVISYEWAFDNRPTNVINGSKSEVFTIQDNFPTDIFAKIGIVGRTEGPCLQDINTKSSATRLVSLEIVMPVGAANPSGACISFLEGYKPGSSPNGVKVFLTQDSRVQNPFRGKYAYTLSWEY